MTRPFVATLAQCFDLAVEACARIVVGGEPFEGLNPLLERADFLAEPESLLAVVAAAGSAAGRETRLQNLPDGHHDDDAEDHFEWIHVRFSPFSLSSVERIGGPVVAQLVDLVGNRDALVGGDPFSSEEHKSAPQSLIRILYG